MPINYARSRIVVASSAAGLEAPLDTVWVHIGDVGGLERSVRKARALGFQGKMCIHPDQVATLNEIFSPSEEDLEQARRIIRAFQRAESEGRGTCVVDGKMIDTAMALQAQKLIRTAQGLAGR